MKKKLLAASLTAVMLSAILTGCSGKGIASYDDDDDWDTSGTGIGKTESQNTGSQNNDSDVKPTDLLDINDGEVTGCVSYAKNVSVPSGVTSLANHVFADHTELVTVSLPDGLTKIGSGAFSGCTNLFSLYIPNGVTKIPDNAFEGCSSLAAVYIPQSVTEIGKNAFRGCLSLICIEVPETIESIADNAFDGCSSLTANYRDTTFSARDVIDLCDIVNGNYKRVDIPYKQAQEIIGDMVSPQHYGSVAASKTYTFDDINVVDILWLIYFLNAKTDYAFKPTYVQENELSGNIDAYYKLTDVEKFAKEYINPDFDINVWKKNAKTWNGDDEYFIYPTSPGSNFVNFVIEDCYSMGHKTYITVGSYLFTESGTSMNSFLENSSSYSDDNGRYKLTYRNDNGKYYLEAMEKVTIDDLEPWNQTLVKLFDEFNSISESTDYGKTTFKEYTFVDVNNDGEKDFVVGITHDSGTGALNALSYYEWIVDKKDESWHYVKGSNGWYTSVVLKTDTSNGKTVKSYFESYYTESQIISAIDNNYNMETSLCSKFINYNNREDSWFKIGDKNVSETEYNDYVKRFEGIKYTSFESMTLMEFIENFRTSFS